jgi:hypothetical protein
MEAKKISTIELNLGYSNYEYCCDNMDYISYRLTFNPYLKKFITLCQKYNVDFYRKINDNYCILKKIHIINQIKKIIKRHINNHIIILKSILISDNVNYFEENDKITNLNYHKINKLNKFIDLVDLVYEYKLLHAESINEPIIDIRDEYNNLVNLGDLTNIKLFKSNKTSSTDDIIIIDSYSW